MLLNTLFFEEEVTKNPAKEITENGNDAALKMAKAIIEGMTGEFINIVMPTKAIKRRVITANSTTPLRRCFWAGCCLPMRLFGAIKNFF